MSSSTTKKIWDNKSDPIKNNTAPLAPLQMPGNEHQMWPKEQGFWSEEQQRWSSQDKTGLIPRRNDNPITGILR